MYQTLWQVLGYQVKEAVLLPATRKSWWSTTVVPKPSHTLESPGGPLYTPTSGPPNRPVGSKSLAQGLTQSYFLNPMCCSCTSRVETHWSSRRVDVWRANHRQWDKSHNNSRWAFTGKWWYFPLVHNYNSKRNVFRDPEDRRPGYTADKCHMYLLPTPTPKKLIKKWQVPCIKWLFFLCGTKWMILFFYISQELDIVSLGK